MVMGRRSSLLLSYCVILAFVATTSNASVELSIAEAEQEFYYVNNVQYSTFTHRTYELACLESGGCLNISVVSQPLLQICGDCRNITRNLGCYQSQLNADTNFKILQALSFSEHTSLPVLDMREGTMVCSSGQLSAFVSVDIPEGTSGGSGLNGFELATWHSAGNRFAKAISRTVDDCHIYALQATTVRITSFTVQPGNDFIPAVISVPIQPFNLTSLRSLHQNNGASTFLSQGAVHISCITVRGFDFIQLTEVDRVLYSADSTVLTAITVRCDSLQYAEGSKLSCHSSAIEPLPPTTISPYAGGLAVEVRVGGMHGELAYSGPGVRCQSSENNTCLSMYTLGDGLGNEATVALPAIRHANLFVLPVASRSLALIGEEQGLCAIRNGGGEVSRYVEISGVEGVFKGYFDQGILQAGTIIECSQKCMVIAQTAMLQKEFNLQGYIGDYVVATPLTFGADDSLAIILSSSVALLVCLGLLAWKLDARSLMFPRVYDERVLSLTARREIPFALRAVGSRESTRNLPVAEVYT